MKLYVIRHAKAKSNELKIAASSVEKYCGGLTKEGMQESKELVSELKKYKFDIFIVSPLKRSIQTIQPYLDTLDNPTVVVSELVNERRLGDFAGKKIEEVERFKEKYVIDRISWVPPNGESLLEVYERAKKFLSYIKRKFKGKSVLLCSHEVFIRCLDIAMKNGNIFHFSSSGRIDNGEFRKYIL